MLNELFSLRDLVTILKQQEIIAYPTEAVFGLGCDPDSEQAVQRLLILKKRSWEKGLILVAANYAQLVNYIDENRLDDRQKKHIFSQRINPITWILPARSTTPDWLTGKFPSLAVRVSFFEPVRRLCLRFGKPLVSTSANLSGQPPMRHAHEIRKQFGDDFPIMDEVVGGFLNPSEIRDPLLGDKLIRRHS